MDRRRWVHFKVLYSENENVHRRWTIEQLNKQIQATLQLLVSKCSDVAGEPFSDPRWYLQVC